MFLKSLFLTVSNFVSKKVTHFLETLSPVDHGFYLLIFPLGKTGRLDAASVGLSSIPSSGIRFQNRPLEKYSPPGDEAFVREKNLRRFHDQGHEGSFLGSSP